MTGAFSFKITATGRRMRGVGAIATPRGVIRTPAFMPVGTAATVKAMLPERRARAAGADIILGNTYHLMLRPGAERVAGSAGCTASCTGSKPILTDTGGYPGHVAVEAPQASTRRA